MPTPKTKPQAKSERPPSIQPAAEPPEKPKPNLTSLLMECFQFDDDADGEDRQLLLEILQEWKKSPYTFRAIAADEALVAVDVHIGVDRLENPQFLELLGLFGRAVSGDGYGGFREQLIARLLREGSEEMDFEQALAIIAIEFEDQNTQLGAARQGLKEYPELLAADIEKASKALSERRREASDAK